jgi:hypothetical protein
MSLRPLAALAATAAGLALAPAAAPAAVLPTPVTVAIATSPTSPTTADPVTLTATVNGTKEVPQRIAWDLDADGQYDDATGATVTQKFAAGHHAVGVQASWAATVAVTRTATAAFDVAEAATTTAPPATTTPTPPPTPAPPAGIVAPPVVVQPQAPAPVEPQAPAECRSTFTSGRLAVRGLCLVVDGQKVTSKYPINLNGLFIGPLNGKAIKIDAGHLTAESAKVKFNAQNANVTLFQGKLDWTIANDQIKNVKIAPGTTVGGMRMTALAGPPTLADGGASHLRFHLKLPDDLGGTTSDKPVDVLLGGAKAAAADAGTAFGFRVPLAWLPGLGLHDIVASYKGGDLWTMTAGVRLPTPISTDITGEVGVRGGKFDHASGQAQYDGKGPLAYGVRLQRIAFAVEVKPKSSQCAPTLNGARPVIALCGTVQLAAGPSLMGNPMISVDGGLGWLAYENRPAVFRAYGSMQIVNIPLAKATFELRSNGYVAASAYVGYAIKDLASIKGNLSLAMKGAQFNAEGSVNACIDAVDLCAGAAALYSSAGMAICLNVDTWLGDWHPGLGMRWGKAPKAYFSGCDLAPYRAVLSATAASATKRVTVPAGLPGVVISARGAGGAAPDVTFVGPRGERLAAPKDKNYAGGRGFLVIKNPREGVTQVAIAKPSAGAWRVEVNAGSPAVTQVQTAHGLAQPAVHARVSGRGARRTLSYKIDAQPGQVVRFEERGRTAGAVIGRARGSHGTLRFAPAAGAAERRTIVAVVEQDGAPRAVLRVASYRAPRAAKPGAPRELRVRRAGTRVVASWKTTAAASTVRVALSDGRRLVLRSRNGRATVRGVARGVRATVEVRGTTAAGVEGAPASARLG